MEVGIKRKRGRPRKSESRRSIVSWSSSGRRDEMVGQVICGVVEASFEAGYLVNVQLPPTSTSTSTTSSCSSIGEDDNNYLNLRGVVFRQDKVCSITITNDVAPHANMYLRKHLPSCPPPHHPLHPTLLTNSTSPEEEDDDHMQVDAPPKNTCTTSFQEEKQEEADHLFLTPQLLLNPTNTTTTTNNLNLELNHPPTTTTTFIESQPPKPKFMDIFSTTFNNASTTQLPQNITHPHHSTPQLLHPISTTQGRIIVDHPTTTGSAPPSTNTCTN